MLKFWQCGATSDSKKSLLRKDYRFQLLATIFICIITFGHGVGIGWLSPTLVSIQNPDKTPLEFAMTIDEVSWLGSMIGLGSLCGNIVIGCLLNSAGRKFCLYLMAFPYATLWILIYTAKNVAFLYAARFLCGFTGGAGYAVIPIYISEIADTNIRGALSSVVMLSVNSGILVGYILATHLNYYLIPCVAIVLPIVYFIANLFLPETTQHLIRKEKYTAAERSFAFYKNRNINCETNRLEFEEIKTTINKGRALHAGDLHWRDFFTRSALKAFAGAIVLSLGYQFSGIFSFINYMSDIFKASGSILDSNTCTIIIGFVQIIGVYTSTMLVDAWGRRRLMLISTCGVSIGCFAFGIFTYFAQKHDLSHLNWLPLFLMVAIIYIANIGLIGIFFLVTVELFPAKIRAAGSTFSMIILSALIFCTLKLFPLLLHDYGISITMWFSAVSSLITFIYFFMFLQETKDKSMLED